MVREDEAARFTYPPRDRFKGVSNQLVPWDALIQISLTLALGAGGAVIIYIKAYSRKKGELQAEIEDSPRIKGIESNIRQMSAMQSSFGEKKLDSYERLARIFSILRPDFDIMSEWDKRLEKDDLAKVALEIPTDIRQKELSNLRETLKDLSIREGWLWHWKVNSIVYVIEFLLGEICGALKYYDQEKKDWEVKRSHFQVAVEYSSLVLDLSSKFNQEVRNELALGEYLTGLVADDDEYGAYAKWLGDKKRAKSQAIHDKNPELNERIRSSIKEQQVEANKKFLENLRQQIADNSNTENP